MTCLLIDAVFLAVPVKIGIDMPVQKNKQSKGFVFIKDLDGTFFVGIYQQGDRPANKIHRRLIEFSRDTDAAVIIDLPDEFIPEEVV